VALRPGAATGSPAAVSASGDFSRIDLKQPHALSFDVTFRCALNKLRWTIRNLPHVLLHVDGHRNPHKTYNARLLHVLLHVAVRVLHGCSTPALHLPRPHPDPRRRGRGCIHTPSLLGSWPKVFER
jgi:hypothetical protein